MSQKICVGLIFGGRSGEHEVSLASAMSVFNALDKKKYDVVLLGIDKTGRWLMPEANFFLTHQNNPMQMKLSDVKGSVGLVPYRSATQMVALDGAPLPDSVKKMDVALPILHGTYGEDGTLQGLLEMAEIPFVGSGVLGSAIGMDKDVARRLLKSAGIPVVNTLSVFKHEFLADRKKLTNKILESFQLPVFVKPANAGSSVGVSKVKVAAALEAALENAFDYDLKVLVEHGVQARELECSVLGNEEPRASVVGEIVPHHEFYSYEAKYLDENGMHYHIPAQDLAPEISHRVREYAVQAFKTLELRGLARVDFFLDKVSGELFLNEVNTIPGFTKISMYPKMWEASGLPYSALLDEIIRLALEYHKTKSALSTTYIAR